MKRTLMSLGARSRLLGWHLQRAGPRIHYIAGPPAMVKGLHEMLTKAGVDNDIRAEAGY